MPARRTSVATQANRNLDAVDTVEEAIACVLAAEVAARADTERARDAARESDEDARAGVRAIAARTAARIAAVRAAFAREADAQVGALQREADALAAPHALTDADHALLARALAALAARLTGAPE